MKSKGGVSGYKWLNSAWLRTDREIAAELLRRHGWRLPPGTVFNIRKAAEAKLQRLLRKELG